MTDIKPTWNGATKRSILTSTVPRLLHSSDEDGHTTYSRLITYDFHCSTYPELDGRSNLTGRRVGLWRSEVRKSLDDTYRLESTCMWLGSIRPCVFTFPDKPEAPLPASYDYEPLAWNRAKGHRGI